MLKHIKSYWAFHHCRTRMIFFGSTRKSSGVAPLQLHNVKRRSKH